MLSSSISNMAKANIETKSGTKIVVEGSAEEVSAIIAAVQSKERMNEVREQFIQASQRTKKIAGPSLPDKILELKEGGFFNKPQSLVAVRNALSQQGHIYALPIASTALIRLVRKGQLGRLKEGINWQYVKR